MGEQVSTGKVEENGKKGQYDETGLITGELTQKKLKKCGQRKKRKKRKGRKHHCKPEGKSCRKAEQKGETEIVFILPKGEQIKQGGWQGVNKPKRGKFANP